MITQTMHIVIVILCHVVLILQQPPPVASQAPLAPSSRNCMAQPCAYRGECRGASNECGDTVAHCNAESIWVPSCGGGANLDKPVVPRGPPTMPPTSGPTTAWEKWISNSNGNSKREEEDNNGRIEDNNAPATTTTTSFSNTSANNNNGGQQQPGVQPGQTTNNQDTNGEEYIRNNQTGTFDAEGWGYYGEEEEEGILDKAKFWENDSSAMESAVTEVVFLVGAVVAWALLL